MKTIRKLKAEFRSLQRQERAAKAQVKKWNENLQTGGYVLEIVCITTINLRHNLTLWRKNLKEIKKQIKEKSAEVKKAELERKKNPEAYRESSEPFNNKAWLEDEYIQKRKTVRLIADECDTSPMTISRWLNRHGIEVRDRKESIYLGWEHTRWYKRPEDDEASQAM